MTRTMPSESQPASSQVSDADIAEAVRALYTDGVVGRKGAFSREFVQALGEDVMAAFAEARSRPHGAVGRGPNRWYVEIHPQALRGFVELASHPWVQAVSEAVLGPDYRIVEVGFDIPFPGAMNQPWHRDFPSPPETRDERRLTSLAFNVTTVDTAEDMGPFEIALGTQFDDSPDFEHGMFPPKSYYPRYEERAVRKYPQVGDISARSALHALLTFTALLFCAQVYAQTNAIQSVNVSAQSGGRVLVRVTMKDPPANPPAAPDPGSPVTSTP